MNKRADYGSDISSHMYDESYNDPGSTTARRDYNSVNRMLKQILSGDHSGVFRGARPWGTVTDDAGKRDIGHKTTALYVHGDKFGLLPYAEWKNKALQHIGTIGDHGFQDEGSLTKPQRYFVVTDRGNVSFNDLEYPTSMFMDNGKFLKRVAKVIYKDNPQVLANIDKNINRLSELRKEDKDIDQEVSSKTKRVWDLYNKALAAKNKAVGELERKIFDNDKKIYDIQYERNPKGYKKDPEYIKLNKENDELDRQIDSHPAEKEYHRIRKLLDQTNKDTYGPGTDIHRRMAAINREYNKIYSGNLYASKKASVLKQSNWFTNLFASDDEVKDIEDKKKRKEEKAKKAKKNALRFLLETYDGVVDRM